MLQNQHLQLAEAGLEKKGYLDTAPQIIPSNLFGVFFLWGFVFVSQPVTCNTDCALFPTLTFLLLLSLSQLWRSKRSKGFGSSANNQICCFFFFLLSVGWCGLGRKPGVSVYYPLLLLSTSLLSMWCPREANWDNKTLHSPEPRKCFWKPLMR